MKKNPSFIYHHIKDSNNLDVVMHGVNKGIDSQFIQKIVNESYRNGNTVIAFNFEFYDRGEHSSSGVELEEERKSLKSILEYCEYKKYKKVRLIGKSLGGIVIGRYLKELSLNSHEQFEVVIFGYDIGYIDINDFKGRIRIVQGSKDKFGDINAVKEDLKGSISKLIEYIEIEGASHSYCNPENDEPIYEDKAIQLGLQ